MEPGPSLLIGLVMELLTIDTRSVKDINIAERNQILMHIGDIVIGHDGWTITGKAVSKANVDDTAAGIKTGPNVYLSDNGKKIASTAQ